MRVGILLLGVLIACGGDDDAGLDAASLDGGTRDSGSDVGARDVGEDARGDDDAGDQPDASVATPLFFSDWSGGDHMDGDRWDRVRGFPEAVFEVLAADDESIGACSGFPHSDSVLAASYNGPSGPTFEGNAQLGAMGVLPAGSTFVVSIWFCNANESGVEGWSHPFNSEGWPGSIQYIMWQMQPTSTTTFNVGVNAGTHPDGRGRGFVRFNSPDLNNGVWYEQQVVVERIDRNNTRMYARILDVDGSVLFSSDDYQNVMGETLSERWQRPEPAMIADVDDPVEDLTFGPEGPAVPDGSGSGGVMYFARLLIADVAPDPEASCWLCGANANRR